MGFKKAISNDLDVEGVARKIQAFSTVDRNPQMASEMIIAVKVHIFPRLSARIPSGNLDVDFHGFMGMEKAIA